MSDKTCAYLDMARQRYKELEPLSDADLLTLDYFWQGMIDCYLTFTTEQLQTIAGTIGLKQLIPETNKNASNWCTQLTLARYSFLSVIVCFTVVFLQVQDTTWKKLKVVSTQFLLETSNSEHEQDFLATIVLH